MRNILMILALIAVLPFPAAAQRSPAERLSAARASAAQAGIPLELIDTRIAEGRAKGISEIRIAEAIEKRGRGLVQARQTMIAAGIVPSAADLASGADALEAGVDVEALRAVVQAARVQERPVALAVLGELVRQGMPVQQARDRVRSALQRREDNLGDLPRRTAAERAAARGQNGAAAGRPAAQPANPGRGGANQGGRPATVPPAGRGGNGGGRPQ